MAGSSFLKKKKMKSVFDNYECDGQIDIMDYLKSQQLDYTYERNGKKHPAPAWMRRERCENCKRWELLPVEDQPPYGWGVFGQCNFIHDPKQKRYEKTSSVSYCQDFILKEAADDNTTLDNRNM